MTIDNGFLDNITPEQRTRIFEMIAYSATRAAHESGANGESLAEAFRYVSGVVNAIGMQVVGIPLDAEVTREPVSALEKDEKEILRITVAYAKLCDEFAANLECRESEENDSTEKE